MSFNAEENGGIKDRHHWHAALPSFGGSLIPDLRIACASSFTNGACADRM
jgi:hypothetical protein